MNAVRTVALALGVLAIGGVTSALAQTGTAIPTNEVFFHQLARKAAGQVDSLANLRGAGRLVWRVANEEDVRLHHALTLIQSNLGQTANQHAMGDSLCTISFCINKAEVRYVSARSRGIWSQPWIRREAILQLDPLLLRKDGAQTLAPISFLEEDFIPWDDVATVEAESPYFQNLVLPDMPPGKGWLKVLLLAGTMGGVTALFYTIRSR